MKITCHMTIFQAIHNYPQAVDVFKAYGMPCSGCLAMMDETIEAGARRHGADLQKLLADLDAVAENSERRQLNEKRTGK
jgi:hybrid cluster-associated redox disulfide protein